MKVCLKSSIAVACGSLIALASASAQPLPTFTAADGTEWLVPTALNGRTYDQAQFALSTNGFRLATRAEVEGLLGPDGGDATAAVTDLENRGGAGPCRNFDRDVIGVRGTYDDRDSGTERIRLGAAVAIKGGVVRIDDDSSNALTRVSILNTAESCGVLFAVREPRTVCGTPTNPSDFDCDGESDRIVWRPGTGVWYVRRSYLKDLFITQWGLPGDRPLVGDYTGDGVPDLVVYRPGQGNWFVLSLGLDFARSATVRQWGLPGDVPLSGDFDGDGVKDFAIYRTSTGTYYWRTSGTADGFGVEQWGLPSDIPLGVASPDGN